eukprot:14021651-Alexandrium_andersonii.AAC.1
MASPVATLTSMVEQQGCLCHTQWLPAKTSECCDCECLCENINSKSPALVREDVLAVAARASQSCCAQ